ncbi:MAG: YidC/Oxa1 family membrane protein insertase [Treponema sp.]
MSGMLFNIIIYPIIQIVEFIFMLSQRIFSNTGFSVMCISVAVTVLCLPLYAVAEQWQERERQTQNRLKSGIARIKAAFKGDEQYMILSVFYKQNHYHPMMALRSSFGLLIQVPFFIAAYSYLSHLEILRGTPFLFIRDLGAPDALLTVGGGGGGTNLLPIAMTLINVIAGAVYTRGFAFKEKAQLYGMALLFLVLLYNSPAGLVLYWTLNNVFSLLKNIYYKIKSPHKMNVLLWAGAAAFVFVIAYLNYYRIGGNARVRKILTFILAAAAFTLAVFPIVQKRIKVDLTKILSGKESFALFITSALLLTLTSGFLLPTNMIVSSPQEFSYVDRYASPLFFIGNTLTQAIGFCVFWPLALYFLFSDKTKRIFAVTAAFVAVSALINAFIFPGKYGFISTALVFAYDVKHPLSESAINLGALAIVAFAVAAVIQFKKTKMLTTLAALASFSLFALSSFNVIRIAGAFKSLASYRKPEQAAGATSVEPIFSLSKKGKNVVVLMVDRAISVLVPYVFDDYPALKTQYSGFTFYPNTVSFNGYTSLGSPPIFGGYESTPTAINARKDVPLLQKRNEALMMMPRIFDEHGFHVTATDLPYANGNWIPDMSIFEPYPNIKTYVTDSFYTDLWCTENNLHLPSASDVLKRNMIWYSLLKTSPLLLRESIYGSGNWGALTRNVALRKTLNGYAVLDYLPRLVSIVDDNSSNALIMNNNTTHEYSLLQAPEYRPVTAVTEFGSGKYAKRIDYSVNAATVMRLADWFAYMKKNGVYDNTRIIIVSDHGPEENVVTRNHLPFEQDQFNAFLMVKDFNAVGDIKTDNTFMTNADVPSLALADLIENPVNPFTGNPITQDAKKDPVYIAISGTQLLGTNAYQFLIDPKQDFYVHGNLFEPENWVPADRKN